jgi:hypothetical protein
MQRVIEKPYHKWLPGEKFRLLNCTSAEIYDIADGMNLPYITVYTMWKHLHEEKTTEMAHFDYSKLVPLKSLFVRCPVCNGTTGVNENAYCHSCLSQWNPISLEPLKGLHKADPVD